MTAVTQETALVGESVTLREITAADIADVAAILGEPEVSKWWGPDWTAATVRRDLLEDPGTHCNVIVHEGDIMGFINFAEENDPDCRSASLDVAIGEAWTGKGLAREAMAVLISHLYAARGHHRVTIDPRVTNARAMNCYTSLGFRPVGVMREYERDDAGIWHDALLMELLVRDFKRTV